MGSVGTSPSLDGGKPSAPILRHWSKTGRSELVIAQRLHTSDMLLQEDEPIPSSSLEKLNVENGERRPYPLHFYARRVLWLCCWYTIWKIAPRRGRLWLLNLFGAKIGHPAKIFGSAKIQFPWQLRCGRFCAIGPNVEIYNLGNVSLGDRVVVSQDVYLCAGTHDYQHPEMPLIRDTIHIESGAWICAGAFIGPGVTVGEGAVVGARAVVMKDVEPWTVVAGNPARFIKDRKISQKDN